MLNITSTRALLIPRSFEVLFYFQAEMYLKGTMGCKESNVGRSYRTGLCIWFAFQLFHTAFLSLTRQATLGSFHNALQPFTLASSLCSRPFRVALREMHLDLKEPISMDSLKASLQIPRRQMTWQQRRTSKTNIVHCATLLRTYSGESIPSSGTFSCTRWVNLWWWDGWRLQSVLLNK